MDEEYSRVVKNKRKIKKNTKKKKKKIPKKKGFFGKLWSLILSIMVVLMFTVGGVAVGGGLYGYSLFKTYQQSTPDLNVDLLNNPIPSEITDVNGNLIARVGSEERDEVSIEDVPKEYLDALISTEDSHFFKHNGFNVFRTLQAAVGNVLNGFGSQGGSTLTQQLIKLTFLDQNDTSLKRKTHEVTLAWELEDKFSKEDILEMYINKVYMGDGVYGVETAAEHFYGKPLKDLTIPQQALLAGIPQSPNNWNPYSNPEGAKRRRDIVLYRMLDESKISETEYDAYVNTPIDAGLQPKEESSQIHFFVEKEYQLYVDSIIKEVKRETGLDPYRAGLTIKSALNTEMQKVSNEITNTENIINYANDDMFVAFTIIENNTGRVIANGSGNRNTEIVNGGYNYATDIVRQAGSTMKPILAYGPAVEYLGYGGGDTIVDGPYKYSTGQSVNNYDMSFKGNITLSQALGGSRNIPALKLQAKVGTKKAFEFANKLGFSYTEDEYVESGVISANASPFEMAQGYSVFANGGKFIPSHFVVEVKDKNDKVVYTEPEGEQVMKDSTAYVVTSMLQTTVDKTYGTAYNKISKYGNDVALKTGTTNYSSQEKRQLGIKSGVPDIWMIGYTPKHTIAIWIGFDSRSDAVVGTEQYKTREIFSNILKHLGDRNQSFKVPKSVYQSGGHYYPRK